MKRNGWQTLPLIELKENKKHALNGGPFGSNLVSNDYVDDGVPVIRGTNLPNDARFSLDDLVYVSEEKADELLPNNAHPGDIVFTQRGTLGQVGLIPSTSKFKRFVISQSQMKLTVDQEKADRLFLFYYFRWPETIQRIHNVSFSSGVPHINLEILRSFEVTLPTLPVQQTIASILSAYDDLIENNTRRIKILEEMAQAIYREWFVEFRAPGAELRKATPEEQKLTGKDKFPKGWEVKCLGDMADIQWGDTSTTKASYVEVGFDAYSASGLDGKLDHFDFDRDGIVLSAIGANCGLTWYARGKWSCIKNTIRFWSKSEKSSTELLYFATLGKDFWPRRGAAQPFISQGDAMKIEFVCPDKSTLERFTQVAKDKLHQISILTWKNMNLRRTRDLLLPKLISGEVEVNNISISNLRDIP